MKRYIDFQNESWQDRTEGRMQAARWEACLDGIGTEPPCAGVIDTAPVDLLEELINEGWVDVPHAPSVMLLRRAARHAVMESLADDLDCLAPHEHTLVERMLIGDGRVFLETVSEFEAAYTLRLRLWCDIGVYQERPCARLDEKLMRKLLALLMRKEHAQRRSLIFVFDGMIHGLLYLTGFLDDQPPRRRFVQEVLQAHETPKTLRLARNYIEASFDCYTMAGCNLLLHKSVATPESLVSALASQRAFQMPSVTSGQLIGSMNGLLPEEAPADERLKLALKGTLRPEYEPEEAANDLRMLVKQGATLSVLRDVVTGMLCVLPTKHIDDALQVLSLQTPRWVTPWTSGAQPVASGNVMGMLH